MARPRKARNGLLGWPGYAFVPAGALAEFGAATDRDEIVKYSPTGQAEIERWPVAVILKNLAFFAANFLWLKNFKESERGRSTATMTEIGQWIALTRAMAASFPYGGTVGQEMRALADRVERLQSTPTRYSNSPPRGRSEELQYRFNLTLWAMNEVRKAARLSPIMFWQEQVGALAAAALPADRLDVFDYKAIEKRIKRFAQKLKPGSQPELMATALLDATIHGPMLADGARRHPKPPAVSPTNQTRRLV